MEGRGRGKERLVSGWVGGRGGEVSKVRLVVVPEMFELERRGGGVLYTLELESDTCWFLEYESALGRRVPTVVALQMVHRFRWVRRVDGERVFTQRTEKTVSSTSVFFSLSVPTVQRSNRKEGRTNRFCSARTLAGGTSNRQFGQ